ncbi:hypothetical protein JYT51_02395, partial [Candidatus Amoebophilus asiaticus]|nr:hypothetical protein [Candidatus Amoebophilus asiaticus]
MAMRKRTSLLIVPFLVMMIICRAQDRKTIDSLLQIINIAKQDSVKIRNLLVVSAKYRNLNVD